MGAPDIVLLVICLLLAGYLFILPVASSVALRNVLLWMAALLLAIRFVRDRAACGELFRIGWCPFDRGLG